MSQKYTVNLTPDEAFDRLTKSLRDIIDVMLRTGNFSGTLQAYGMATIAREYLKNEGYETNKLDVAMKECVNIIEPGVIASLYGGGFEVNAEGDLSLL